MLFVASDIHGSINIDTLRYDNFPAQSNQGDYLLICGDAGIVWDGGEKDKELMQWYNSQPYTTLFVDGNHENFDLLNRYPISYWKGGKTHRISEKIIHLIRGQVYEGIVDKERIFAFGGAFSIKKIKGDSKVPIWNEEMPIENEYNEGKKNLLKYGFTVDYIFTHTCPRSCLSELPASYYDEGEKELNDYLEWIHEHVKYSSWYFGHFHCDKKIGNLVALYKKIVRIV